MLTAAVDDDGRRLDRILRKALRDLPLSAIHRLLRKHAVLVNGKTAAADCRVRAGETITVTLDSLYPGNNLQSDFMGDFSKNKPIQISTDAFPEILFEGEGLLVLNKPAGIAVHGMENNKKGNAGKTSLETLVRSYLKPKLPPSLSFRPGPLHRLDKMSSGIIVFSAGLEGARYFSALIRDRQIKKTYLALVEGCIKKDEVWQDDLARDHEVKKTFTVKTANAKIKREMKTVFKPALTRIKPLLINSAYTLIQAEIETGRTHQIRAQAAFHGHPLIGDIKYGAKPFEVSRDPPIADSFMLHAWRMQIPVGTSFLSIPNLIEAPLPENFKRKIYELFGKNLDGL